MSTKTVYVIKYTNILTGERCTYLSVGFETENDAQDELDKLLKEAAKKKYSYDELYKIPSQYRRSWMVGIGWTIEPIKIREIN